MRIIRSELVDLLKAASYGMGQSAKDKIIEKLFLAKFGSQLIVRSTTRHVFTHVFSESDEFKISPDFGVLIAGKSFIGFLNEVKEDEIELTYENSAIRIQTDKGYDVKFPGEPYQNVGYPKAPDKPDKLAATFQIEEILAGLNFVKDYTKDISNASMETVLELRNSCLVGGTASAVALWRCKDLEGRFILKSHISKLLIPFLRNIKEDSMEIYENDKVTYFCFPNGWWFASLAVSPSVKRWPPIEDVEDDGSYQGKVCFSRTEISREIQTLQHTIDDKVTRVQFDFKKEPDPHCELSFTNSLGQVSKSKIPCIDLVWKDAPQTFRISYKKFQEVMKSFVSEEVKMEMYFHDNTIRILDEVQAITYEAILSLRS